MMGFSQRNLCNRQRIRMRVVTNGGGAGREHKIYFDLSTICISLGLGVVLVTLSYYATVLSKTSYCVLG